MSLPAIAAGAVIGGTVLSAMSQREQLGAQAETAQLNAQIAAENARIVRAEARRKAKRVGREGKELESTQRALFGKSGVLLSGSPQEIFAETARTTAEDIDAILLAGELGSREALTQAEMSRREARSLRKAKDIAPLATLLSGGGQAAAIGIGG